MAAPASPASTWFFTCGHEGGPPLGARDACQLRQSSPPRVNRHHAVAGPAPRPARRSPARAEQPTTQPTSRGCWVGCSKLTYECVCPACRMVWSLQLRVRISFITAQPNSNAQANTRARMQETKTHMKEQTNTQTNARTNKQRQTHRRAADTETHNTATQHNTHMCTSAWVRRT